MADGSVDIDVKVNGKQATAEVNNLKSSLKGIGGDNLKPTTQSFKQLGVVAGLTSSIVSKGLGIVKDSIGGAVQRVDQLNRFPKVLQAMGFSAKDANASFKILDNGIKGLPTAMDDIQPLATQLANITGSAKKGATAAVALNDAFLASGASAQDTSRGLVQMNQMLAAGKVDMQSWKTLTETMSPALKKVAAGFGLVGKSAINDLYKSLQSGKIPMEEFLQKFVELDKAQGGFAETAKIASAGILTSFANMKTAIKRGIADIIQAIGSSNVSGVIEGIGKGFESVAKVIAGTIKAISPLAPAIIAVGVAWAGVKIGMWVNDLGIVQKGFTVFLGHINTFKLGVGDALKLLTSNFKEFNNLKFDTKFFQEFQKGMQGLVKVSKSTVNAIKNGFKNVGSAIVNAFKGIPQLVGNIFNNLVTAVTHPVNTIKTIILSIGGAFKALVSAIVANPILLVFAAITTAVVAMATAWKTNFGGIRDFTNAVFSGIGQAFSPVIRSFQELLKSINITVPGIGKLSDIFGKFGTVLIGIAVGGLALVADIIRIIADVAMAAAYAVKALGDALSRNWKAAANDMKQAGKSISNIFDGSKSAVAKVSESMDKLDLSNKKATKSSKSHANQAKATSSALDSMGSSSESAGATIERSSKKSVASVKEIGVAGQESGKAVKEYLANDMADTLDFFANRAQAVAKQVSESFTSAFAGNGKEATPIEKYTQAMTKVIDDFQSSMKQKQAQYQKAIKTNNKEALDALLKDKQTNSADMLAAEKSLQQMLLTNKTIEGKQLTAQERQASNEMLALISENLVKQNELYINATEQKLAHGEKLSKSEMAATTARIQQQGQQELLLRQANNEKIKAIQEQMNSTQDGFMKQMYQSQIDKLIEANATSEAQLQSHYGTLLTTISNGNSASANAVITGIQNMKNASAAELAGMVGQFRQLNSDVTAQMDVLEAAMKKAGVQGATKFTDALRAGDYEGALASMNPAINNFLEQLPPTFFKGGQKGKDKFVEGLKNKSLTTADLETIFINPIDRGTNDAANSAKKGGEKAGEQFKQGTKNGILGLDNDLSNKMSLAGQKGADALSGKAPKAKEASIFFRNSSLSPLKDVPAGFEGVANRAGTGYNSSLEKAAPNAKNKANSIKNNSLSPLKQGAKDAKDEGDKFNSNWSGAIGKTRKAKDSAGNLANAGKNALKENSKGTDAIGSFFGSGFGQGILGAIPGVAGIAARLAINAVNAIKNNLKIHSPSRVMVQVGKFFTQGFANGITSLATKVKDASRRIALDSLNAINTALEIHSPSKKTYESGQYVGEGMANGIASTQQEVLDATNKLNDSVLKANEDFLKKAQDINKKMVDDITATQKAYEDKYKSTKDSIYNTISLFSEVKKLDEAEKPIGGNLLYNLGTQVEQMQNFQQDLFTLMQRDVPQDLVKELQKMGVNSAAQVKAMTQMTSDQLTQFIALWKQKNIEADKMAKWQMTDDYNAMHDKIGQIRVSANEEFDQAKAEWLGKLREFASDAAKLGDYRFSGKVLGENTVKGLIDGLNSMTGALRKSATNLAKIVSNSIKNELKIASPSKVTKKQGIFAGEGVVVGVESQYSKVKAASKKLVSPLASPMKTVNNAFDRLQSMMSFQPQQRVENVQNYTTVNKLQGIVTDISSRPVEVSVEIDKEQIAKATAKPIDEQLGNIFSRNKRSLGFEGA